MNTQQGAVLAQINELADRVKAALRGRAGKNEWWSYVGQFGDDFFSNDE